MTDYDRSTAKDVIYPGDVRVSAQDHYALQLKEQHAQNGFAPEETIAFLAPLPPPVEEEPEKAPAKKTASKSAKK